MSRRLALAAIVVVAAPGTLRAEPRTQTQLPAEIALTIDDLPQGGREFGLKRMQQMTERFVRGLASNHIPAVALVNEAQLFTMPGEVDARIAMLDAWASAGIELGNHTFAHVPFRDVTLAQYEEGVIRGETVSKLVAERHKLPYRYFRYPNLDTGPGADVRAAFEKFLADRGYTIAPVTADAQDWMFALVYADAKTRGDKPTMKKVVDEYVAYTDASLSYAETFAHALFGRPIRHVFLLHANELNADNLDRVLEAIRRHGYKFVPLARVLEDKAYRSRDMYAGSDGSTGAIHVDRPEPPQWIQEAYGKLDAVAPPRIPGSRN